MLWLGPTTISFDLVGQARKIIRNEAWAEQTWVEKRSFDAADRRGGADDQFTYTFIEDA